MSKAVGASLMASLMAAAWPLTVETVPAPVDVVLQHMLPGRNPTDMFALDLEDLRVFARERGTDGTDGNNDHTGCDDYDDDNNHSYRADQPQRNPRQHGREQAKQVLQEW
ncbi:hypothetical protein GB937_007226 [Aspergillus fischeri]|nr:hypothetical protein GB937_007226 [Aspergillus fischeri]